MLTLEFIRKLADEHTVLTVVSILTKVTLATLRLSWQWAMKRLNEARIWMAKNHWLVWTGGRWPGNVSRLLGRHNHLDTCLWRVDSVIVDRPWASTMILPCMHMLFHQRDNWCNKDSFVFLYRKQILEKHSNWTVCRRSFLETRSRSFLYYPMHHYHWRRHE